MKYLNEKNFKTIVFVCLITLVTILSVVFCAMYFTEKRKELSRDIPRIEKNFIAKNKELIRYAVDSKISQIENTRSRISKKVKSDLLRRVQEARAIVGNLVDQNKNFLDQNQLERLAVQALRPIRFNNERGYFFAAAMNGTIKLYPPDNQLEGCQIEEVFTDERLNTVREMLEIVRSQGEGFCEYDWTLIDDTSGKEQKKVSYVAHVESFEWFIGAGQHVADFDNLVKQMTIAELEESTEADYKSYVFIYDLHNIEGGKDFATMLINPNRPELVGEKISDDFKDLTGKAFRKDFLQGLRLNGEAYVTYWYKKPGEEQPKQKLSYFKFYPRWNWVIAKGVYLDDLEKIIEAEKERLRESVKEGLMGFSLLFLLALTIIIIIAHFFTRGINAIFIEYKQVQRRHQRELEHINRELHKQATTDSLTKIFNRQHFNHCLIQERDRIKRSGKKLSLIILDIDHFKRINDTHGHLSGDGVLKELVTVIQTHVRKTDIFARWGGEEFVILVLDSDRERACRLAEKLCKSVAQFSFSLRQQVTCSFGVTELLGDEQDVEFINRADKALYQAKETGRNRVICI